MLRFERECRTPYSEVYTILDDDQPQGRFDVHYAGAIIHGTLCVLGAVHTGREDEENPIQDLIEDLDDELLDAGAEPDRRSSAGGLHRPRSSGPRSRRVLEQRVQRRRALWGARGARLRSRTKRTRSRRTREPLNRASPLLNLSPVGEEAGRRRQDDADDCRLPHAHPAPGVPWPEGQSLWVDRFHTHRERGVVTEPLFGWSSLAGNIVGGFVAGIAVTAVVGVCIRINKWCLRRNQIRYFREVVSKGIGDLKQVQEGDMHVPAPNVTITPDDLRNLYYDWMRRTLDAAIDHRASEITYDEVYELRQALYAVNWTVDKHRAAPKGLYDSMVRNLQSIKWLGTS